MKVSVEIKGMEAVRARLSGMGKQVAFAASKALNATGKQIADAMPAEIERAIDKPTAFTKKGVRVLKYANKGNLEVTVGFMAAQAKYMEYQIAGGTRNPGKAGLKLPAAIKLNEYGNIPKGVIAGLIALARKDQGAKKAAAKRVKVSAKVDLYYGDPGKDRSGKDWPRGIYKIVNESLIPLIIFPQTVAKYKARFDFQGKAKAIAAREWPAQFDAALADALRTAK
jgi:hypothetical protein